MRFLIFNCLIIASLSYLLTAQPGDSISSWAKEFPNEFEKKFDSHFSKTSAQQSMTELELASVPKEKVDSAPTNDVTENSKQIANNSPDVEFIKKLIDDAVENSTQTLLKKDQLVENDVEVSQVDQSVLKKHSVIAPKADIEEKVSDNSKNKKALIRDDISIGEDFRTLEKNVQDQSSIVVSRSTKDQKITADKKQPFMTTQQRQHALSLLTQDMEMFYAKKLAN